jgi:hypothetical protein
LELILISTNDNHKEVFRRAAELAGRLVTRLTPILGNFDASVALLAAAVDGMRGDIGVSGTADYLRKLADEIENADPATLQ